MPDSLLVTSEIDPSSVFNDVDGIPFSDWLEIEPALKYRQLTARELWNKVVQLSRIKDPFDFSDAKLTEECRWEKSPERVRRWRKCWIANGLLHEVEARPGGGVYSIVDRDPAALLKAVASIQGREFTPMEAAADFLVLQSQAGGPFLAPCEFLAARRKWAVPRVVPFLKFLMDRRAMWRIESVYQMVPRRLGGKMAGHTLPMAEKVGLKYRMRPSALAWFTKWEIDPSLGWFFGHHRAFTPIDMLDDLVARYEAGEWFSVRLDLSKAWNIWESRALHWLKQFESKGWIVLDRKDGKLKVQKLQLPSAHLVSPARKNAGHQLPLKVVLRFLEALDPSLESKKRLVIDEYWILLLRRGAGGNQFTATGNECTEKGMDEDWPKRLRDVGALGAIGAIRPLYKFNGRHQPILYELPKFDITTPYFDVFSWLGGFARQGRKKKRSLVGVGIEILRIGQEKQIFPLGNAFAKLCGVPRTSLDRLRRKLIEEGVLGKKTPGKGKTLAMYSLILPIAKTPGRPRVVSEEKEKQDCEAAATLKPREWLKVRDAIAIPLTPTFEKFGSWVKAYDSRDDDIRQRLSIIKSQKTKAYRENHLTKTSNP